ncbi:MAG: hypothetical protein ACM3JH_00690 [Acidithiobacillales bacterium]
MRRDSLPVLFARGVALATATWKALLLALVLNAALAFVLVRPAATALHETLDRNPWADRARSSADVLFFTNFTRARPDVLGDVGKLEDLVIGAVPPRSPAAVTLPQLLPKQGLAGGVIAFGLLNAALTALLAGGFAGRFGAPGDRSSLASFGSDCGKLGLPSLLLGALSAGLIIAAWRWIYVETGHLYDPRSFRYEWQAVALQLLRLFVLLVVAASVRLVVQYSRAAMGISGSANVASALGRGLGFVLRHPAGTLSLELLFCAVGLLPLVLWATFGRAWDGAAVADFWLLLALQQLVVLVRIVARAAHLGAASAWLRGSAPAGSSGSAPASPSAPETNPV